MSEQSGETATPDNPGNPANVERKGRRGPRKESVIRAEVEAELREKIEAQVRAEMEKAQADEQEQARLRREAADTRPVSGFDITGKPDVKGAKTIHFVEDGLTLFGKVWYRGEELAIEPDTEQWNNCPEFNGKKFFLLDEFEQEAIWGKRFFRDGPWRGKRYTEIDDPELTEEDKAALAKAEQRRNEHFGVLPQRS